MTTVRPAVAPDPPITQVPKEQVGVAIGVLIAGFVGVLLALFAFGYIAEDVMTLETLRADIAVLTWLGQFASPPLTFLATFASVLGADGVMVLLIALTIGLLIRRRWSLALSLILVTAGAQVLNSVLK